MRAQIQVSVTLTEMSCGECGGTYAISEIYREQRYKKGESWTCPYCKTGWGYSGQGENAKLKRELEEEKARKLQALSRANEAEAALQRAQRAKQLADKRTAAGVCQCCQRTFKQLAAHMKTKHPEFKP